MFHLFKDYITRFGGPTGCAGVAITYFLSLVFVSSAVPMLSAAAIGIGDAALQGGVAFGGLEATL